MPIDERYDPPPHACNYKSNSAYRNSLSIVKAHAPQDCKLFRESGARLGNAVGFLIARVQNSVRKVLPRHGSLVVGKGRKVSKMTSKYMRTKRLPCTLYQCSDPAGSSYPAVQDITICSTLGLKETISFDPI